MCSYTSFVDKVEQSGLQLVTQSKREFVKFREISKIIILSSLVQGQSITFELKGSAKSGCVKTVENKKLFLEDGECVMLKDITGVRGSSI